MATDFDTWMPVLKTKVAAVSGLEAVFGYNEIPPKLDGFPCAVILFKRGDWDYSTGGPCKGWYDVQIIVFTAPQILAEAHSVAAGFIKPMRNAIAGAIKLDGNVLQIMPSPDAPTFQGPGQIDWAGMPHVGVAFNYRVDVNETGLYTPAA